LQVPPPLPNADLVNEWVILCAWGIH
jgi:hypothetical protein